MKAKKLKPFKAWLLWDADDTYWPSLHQTRRAAIEEAARNPYVDSKWRVARVKVSNDIPRQ